jgi:hypothetical protein
MPWFSGVLRPDAAVLVVAQLREFSAAWWWGQLLRPEVLGSLVPVAAIFMVTVIVITKLVIRHRERMAMIEQGMDPDAVKRDALKRLFPAGDPSQTAERIDPPRMP